MEFPVGKFRDLIVQEHAVGREGEPDVLVVDLLLLSAVFGEALDHIPVHQRLAAEEIYIKILMVARILDEEIYRALTDLIAHDRTLAVVFTLARKAIGAVEVTGVGHMQAQRLDGEVPLPEVSGKSFELVGRIQFAGFLKGIDVRQAFLRFFAGNAVFGDRLGDNIFRRLGLIPPDHVISNGIDHVDRTRMTIEHNVKSVKLIAVNHIITNRIT